MRGVKRFLKGKPAPKGFRTCARCRGVFPRDQVYTTGHCATCEPIRRREWLDAVPGRRANDARVKRDRNLAKRLGGTDGPLGTAGGVAADGDVVVSG